MYHANVSLTSLDAAYVITTNLTCLASMCGCIVVVILFCLYSEVRTTSRKLMVCLGCANFIQCIAGLLQVSQQSDIIIDAGFKFPQGKSSPESEDTNKFY